jgi:hypothetical protein
VTTKKRCPRCGETKDPRAPRRRLGDDIEVEVIGDTDAARSFWEAFASIAADLLDEGGLLGEDCPSPETATA